jgi:hypothetical protein
MYRLIRSIRYLNELDQLEGGAGQIEVLLEKSIYWFLERNPRLGAPAWEPGYWVMRRRVIEGLLWIRVLYTFDEDEQTVTLHSIQQVVPYKPGDLPE